MSQGDRRMLPMKQCLKCGGKQEPYIDPTCFDEDCPKYSTPTVTPLPEGAYMHITSAGLPAISLQDAPTFTQADLDAAVRAERDACLVIVGSYEDAYAEHNQAGAKCARNIAAAIRARKP